MLSFSLRRFVSILTLTALVLTAPALYAGNGKPKPASGKKEQTTGKTSGKTASTKTAGKAAKKAASDKTASKSTAAKSASGKTASARQSKGDKQSSKSAVTGVREAKGHTAESRSKRSDGRDNKKAASSKGRDRQVADRRTGTKRTSEKPVASAKRSTRKHHDESESATPERRFTARGNSSVTRTMALMLLAERAPDLASLIGVQAPERPDTVVVAEREVPGGGLRGARVIEASYIDAELDESEDPDHVTPEDMRRLEAQQADNINSFYKEFTRYMASLNGDAAVTDNGVDKQSLLEGMMNWLGTRYLFGGMGRNGIDCSAFTGTVYRGLGYKLPRTAAMQWTNGFAIERDNLQFGDLIFFNTRKAVYVSHVGIYLGNGLFTHASSRNGVTISSLNSPYYSTHFIGGRRLDLNDISSADIGR